MHGTWNRRAFCARTCQMICAGALSAGTVACDESPSEPTAPPSPPLTPLDPPPPIDTAPPPPTSSVVVDIPVVAATAVDRTVSTSIQAASPLATLWGSARVRAVVDGYPYDLLLTRTGADTFTALLGTCTHHGCLVSQVARPVFVCPCHGSRFDHNGDVVNGPANAPLQRYRTQYAGGVLAVEL